MEKVSNEERIKNIDEKMAQLKAQRQSIIAREKQKERKARTRRLIQIGALSEQYFRSPDISPEDFEILAKKIVSLPGFDSVLPNDDSEK